MTHVSEAMPKVNEYVLVYAKHCRPKYAIARFTGDVWIDHDRKSQLPHVEYWQHLPEHPTKT